MKKQERKVGKITDVAVASNGKIGCRGRKFEGYVIKKFDNRVTIRSEKVKFISKYERYEKAWSKMHARLPQELKGEIKVGDYIQIAECRPLSKILHCMVIKKIRDASINNNQEGETA